MAEKKEEIDPVAVLVQAAAATLDPALVSEVCRTVVEQQKLLAKLQDTIEELFDSIGSGPTN